MNNVRTLRRLAIAAALASFANVASADFVARIDGNDCSGVFGNPFSTCKIPAIYDPNQSPVIIKFDTNDSQTAFLTPEINTALFPTIDGSEFVFSGLATDLGTGTWTYTPGAGDPLINWFVAKAANNFNLFSNLGNPNSDSWTTPLNQQGSPRGLSHITFYDTGSGTSGGPSSGQVPEPNVSGLALLGMGLLGCTLWLRRRSNNT